VNETGLNVVVDPPPDVPLSSTPLPLLPSGLTDPGITGAAAASSLFLFWQLIKVTLIRRTVNIRLNFFIHNSLLLSIARNVPVMPYLITY
jgi:hypothetical protein